MNILGISAFYHDSAAALLIDGEIRAAVQEERFTREKHDPSFPRHSIQFCLRAGNLKLDEIDLVVFYEKPFLKFERILDTALCFAPNGFSQFRRAMPLWLKDKLFMKKKLVGELSGLTTIGRFDQARLLFSEHHLSHAASAFYPSPFEKAAILTIDGVGEWTTTSCALGEGSQIQIVKEIAFPHSLGLLYSAFTFYTGFRVNSGEYKLMGLAPYGQPRYVQRIKDHLIDIKSDGSYRLNLSYFNYCVGDTMTNDKFHDLFGGPPRHPQSTPTQKDMDLAASIQIVTEEVMLKTCQHLAATTENENLCLAGGVALNAVANGKILKSGIFSKVWIQPAAGDAGGALGAAFLAHHLYGKQPRRPKKGDAMKGALLGPQYSNEEIQRNLLSLGASYETCQEQDLIEKTVRALIDGKIVGWFQGPMEFGPRALGARSILADPRAPEMQSKLNLKIKKRESFRPFAPSVLEEDCRKWFDFDETSPYMLIVADVHDSKRIAVSPESENLFGIDKLKVQRSVIPAVTHVDHSARLQTVNQSDNRMYYALISEFKKLTGVPLLVNTSFNVRGEPIVGSPLDAYRCFMNTEIDILVIGSFFLKKEEQNHAIQLPATEFKMD